MIDQLERTEHTDLGANVKRLIPLCLLLAASGLSSANPVTCEYGKLTRTLEVVYSEPGQAVPCEVIYDKSGEGGTIASLWRANYTAGYCEAKAEGLADKLVDFGFKCSANRDQGTAGENADVASPDPDPGPDPDPDPDPDPGATDTQR